MEPGPRYILTLNDMAAYVMDTGADEAVAVFFRTEHEGLHLQAARTYLAKLEKQ